MSNNLRISHESLDMDDIISDLNPSVGSAMTQNNNLTKQVTEDSHLSFAKTERKEEI
jgi:hypothetical protein